MAFRIEEPWQTLQEIYAPTFNWSRVKHGREGEEQAHDLSGGSSPGGSASGSWLLESSSSESSTSGSSSVGASPVRQSPVEQSASDQTLLDQGPVAEYFWPNLVPHIRQGNNANKGAPVKGSCYICLDDLSVAGLAEPPLKERESSLQTCHYTPCGHIFCRPCFTHAIEEQRTRNPSQPESCPTCRLELSCRQCGKMCDMFAAQVPSSPTPSARNLVPVSDHPAVAAAPAMRPTIPEGAPYKLQCRRCEARRSWMDRLARGRWSEAAREIEPGFVPLLYYIMDGLEGERRKCDREAVAKVFMKIIDDEFDDLNRDREDYIQSKMQRLREQGDNPWF